MISFVSESPVVGIQRPADDQASLWYFNHSLIFIASTHFYWSPERGPRKQRKKHGRLMRSEQHDLNDMLLAHKQEVVELLLDATQEWRDGNTIKEKGMKQKLLPQDAGRAMGVQTVSASPGFRAVPDVFDGSPRGTASASANQQAILSQANNLPTRIDDARSPPHGYAGTPVQTGSPSAPLRSPVKMPPMGVFGVTSSPDRLREGRTSASGSPSRR
jgi:Arb2 domain